MKKYLRLFGNFIVFARSADHQVYVNDLSINISQGCMVLIMWKLTEKGKQHRTNYMSINMYWAGFTKSRKFNI